MKGGVSVGAISTRSQTTGKRVTQLVLWIMLGLIGVTMVLPFVWMISASFDETMILDLSYPPTLLPKEMSLRPYEMMFQNIPMVRYMLNSFAVAVGVVFVSVLSSLSAGYALSKIEFRGRKFVLMLSLATMMVPIEVTMIPQFFLFNQLKLINTYWAFYLPALVYVFGAFFAKQYFDTISGSFRESALLDGASELRIAFAIYVPLCTPLIATLVVLSFLNSWNDFLWPLIAITKGDKYTVQVGMSMFVYQRGERQMPALRMASTVISILPVLAIYLFLQRYIVESIALSGIKQ